LIEGQNRFTVVEGLAQCFRRKEKGGRQGEGGDIQKARIKDTYLKGGGIPRRRKGDVRSHDGKKTKQGIGFFLGGDGEEGGGGGEGAKGNSDSEWCAPERNR